MGRRLVLSLLTNILYLILSSVTLVEILHIDSRDEPPPFRLYQIYYTSRPSQAITVVDSSAHRIAVRRMIDSASPQIDSFFIYTSRAASFPTSHVVVVQLVEDCVGIRASRADGEVATILIGLQSRSVVVHIVDLGTCLVPATDHGSHAQTVVFVVIKEIRKNLARSGHGDPLSVPKFV